MISNMINIINERTTHTSSAALIVMIIYLMERVSFI